MAHRVLGRGYRRNVAANDPRNNHVRKSIASSRRLAAPTPLAAQLLDAVDGGFGKPAKQSFTPPHPGEPTAIRYEQGTRFDLRRHKTVPTMTYEEVTGAPKPIPKDKENQPGFGLFG
jgi:hypothetical protein